MSGRVQAAGDRRLLGWLSVTLLFATVLSLSIGPAGFGIPQRAASLILMEIRLPRTLLGILIGGSLGLAGAVHDRQHHGGHRHVPCAAEAGTSDLGCLHHEHWLAYARREGHWRFCFGLYVAQPLRQSCRGRNEGRHASVLLFVERTTVSLVPRRPGTRTTTTVEGAR